MEREPPMSKTIELTNKIKIASDAYYNDVPMMPDDEFDTMVEELRALDPSSEILKVIGAAPSTTKWAKITHSVTHGSQHKVKTTEELREWAEKHNTKTLLCGEKLDGITLVCTYKNGKLVTAATRGNGVVGEDITKNAILCDGVLQKIDGFTGTIRSELVLPVSKFNQFFKPLGHSNPRNSIAKIRSDEVNMIGYFKSIAFDVIADGEDFKTEYESWTFLKDKVPYVTDSIRGTIDEIIEVYDHYVDTKRDSIDHLIDGLVVRIDDLETSHSLGHTDNRPNGQIAIKFPPKTGKSKIKNIIWDMGVTGKIAPVAEVEPVEIDGVTIRRVTLNNIDWIKSKDIAIGDEIEIARMNDVIPGIQSVVDRTNRASSNIYNLPKQCPVCNGPTFREQVHFICPNIECGGMVFGNMVRWVQATEIMGLGPSIIRELIELGFVTPGMIYDATEADLAKACNSEKNAKKLKIEIDKTRKLKLSQLLRGLNVEMLGRSKSRDIAKEFDTVDSVLSLTVDELAAMDGLAKPTAQKIYDGIQAKRTLIEELVEKIEIVSVSQGGKLAGKSFCVTGELSMPRSQIHTLVQENGGEVRTSVSKKLDYLIIADPNSTSTKAKKARANGTATISEDDFAKMIG